MAPERVITVEYLQPSMADELLLKFPDDSAFDFDYEQSSIWSPLLPRGRTATTAAALSCPFMGLDGYEKLSSQGKLGKVKGKIMKRKGSKSRRSAGAKAKKKTRGLQETPERKLGWGAKLLFAAARHFRRKKRSPGKRALLGNV